MIYFAGVDFFYAGKFFVCIGWSALNNKNCGAGTMDFRRDQFSRLSDF
jgi:hypothetical protein